jgi:hypothetical protein
MRALILLCLALCAGEGFAQAQLGQPAPDFTLTDNGGVEQTLSALEDRVVFLWMVGYA